MGFFSDPAYDVFVILLAITFMLGLVSLLLDIKVMRYELQQGKQTLWYKRPMLVLTIGLMLLIVALVLNLSISRQHQINDIYLYIVDGVLTILGLFCAVYGLMLQMKRLKSSS